MDSTTTETATPNLLTPAWSLPTGVRAFYTNRLEGFSQPPYDSFNLAHHVGDNGADVEDNRRTLPLHDRIAWLKQTHSTRCVRVDEGYVLSLEQAQADASFTRSQRLVCGVLTADCLPILIANQHAVAAVHAGWRGLAGGILQRTLEAMDYHSAATTLWVGPHISARYFQVGEDVYQAFEQYPDAFQPDPEHKHKYLCNLFAICQQICQQMPVSSLVNSEICTYANSQTFYSHRHAQHQGLTQTGRFLCGIYRDNSGL